MDALTVWQPWASLIAIGAKPYEFRGWPAPKAVRGKRIAIHAGARKMRPAEVADLIVRLRLPGEAWSTGLRPEIALPWLETVYLTPGIVPLSSVVCTGVLGAPVRAYDIAADFGYEINDSDRQQHSSWAWPLADIEVLIPPVEARGAQGFWKWDNTGSLL